MKKIVHLKAPGTLNIGNEFINVGARYVIEKVLDGLQSEPYRIYGVEFWQTAVPIGGRPVTPWNTPEMINWINSCDLIFVSGGSMINQYMKSILEEINALQPPKIMLGVGMYHYDEEEKEMARKLFSNYLAVVCRDSKTYEAMQGNQAVNGLDMAFFLEDAYCPPLARGTYAVLNMDLNLRNSFAVKKKYAELQKNYKKVYITENTSTLRKKENFVFLGNWTEFCNMYANTAFVYTTRIHTAIACVIFETPFEYMRKDTGKTAQRNKLFENVGMKLSYGSVFTAEQLKDMQEMIKIKKEETVQEAVNMLRDLK